ncbi:MAG: nitroreductase/quinone reductase family protein [Rubrobacteraceae bacterium]
MNPESLENEDYCYLTTTGRITGRPHEIEIWFALEGSTLEGSTLYMLSGGGDRSDWVKNIRRSPDTTVRIGNSTFEGRGRLVDEPEEDDLARALLFEKYQPRTGGDLTRWRGYALPVAVDLVGPARDGYNR